MCVGLVFAWCLLVCLCATAAFVPLCWLICVCAGFMTVPLICLSVSDKAHSVPRAFRFACRACCVLRQIQCRMLLLPRVLSRSWHAMSIRRRCNPMYLKWSDVSEVVGCDLMIRQPLRERTNRSGVSRRGSCPAGAALRCFGATGS